MIKQDDRFRMVIRDAFRLGGDRGTAVTGVIAVGTVRVGDPVNVVVKGVASRTVVLELEVDRRSVQEASAKDDVAVRIKESTGCSRLAETFSRACDARAHGTADAPMKVFLAILSVTLRS
jgi:translation elongation factor EF-Tu-like GTPase